MTTELAFSGPLEQPSFLRPSSETRLPEGARSQGKLLASLMLAGGMMLTTALTGSASATESFSIIRAGSGGSSSIRADEHRRDTLSRDLLDEWEDYLRRLPQSDEVRPGVVKSVLEFWSRFRTAQIPQPPHATPTDNGGFILSWDRGKHHFEVEFLPTGETVEWFYRDRETEKFEGDEGSLQTAFEMARSYLSIMWTA